MDVPAFPLQLLLRREPGWAGRPAVVVAEDRPQGKVLWANEEARRERVLPGQRYAASLALAPGLRAGVVPDDEIRRGIDETAALLRRFSPDVEPCRDEPGVFWVEASGLGRVHPDLRAWAAEIRGALAATALRAAVVVGFTRFGTYAIARATARADPLVLPDEEAERRLLRRVPLDRLGIEPAARDLLAKLGVRTVDRFLDLPAEGLRARFGDEVRRLHRLASGETRDPLAPEPAAVPVRTAVALEHPEDDGGRLLFLVKRLLDPLLLRTAERRESVAGIEIRLRLDDGGERTDTLRPAAPTLDAAQILELVRLRLESVQLRSGATDVTLTVEPVPATAEQLALFAEKPKRDLAAADRALARLRAEFGEGAVVRATLREAHLPEASFAWEPMEHLTLPRVRAASRPPLVRRIFARPRPLPSRPRHDPGHELGGWMLGGFEHGNVVRIDGPYVVAGGWWAGAGGGEVRREVHFAETSKGRLFWIYYDVRRRRWFLLGEVS